jgi:hypothetical protein
VKFIHLHPGMLTGAEAEENQLSVAISAGALPRHRGHKIVR